MQLVLVGQPYSGKSTIFNAVVGYQSLSTNAPGSTVEHTHGSTDLDGERIDLIDLPGIYSLQVSDDLDDPAVEHVLEAPADTVLVNIIDASVLARSLELTLQLTELRRPMVVALNMSDEVRRKGVTIDADKLAAALGVPVLETTGRSGEGLLALFRAAARAGRERLVPQVLPGPPPVERLLSQFVGLLRNRPLPDGLAPRFVAIKLLERDTCVQRRLDPHLDQSDREAIEARLTELEATTEQPAELVMSAVRHHLAFALFESVARVGPPPSRDLGRRLDQFLTHPVSGYAVLTAVLAVMFFFVFKVGSAIEPAFLAAFERLEPWLAGTFPAGTLPFALARGVVAGFGGGIGIVVPYLLPFFLALALLEDTGYLPRVAFLTDNLMHRIGLHGLSVVPILMGYGCSVPGVLATRILRNRRDRLITATLTTLIPCSARMTIIFGLIGFFISMPAAIFVYVANLALAALVGWVLSRLMPEQSPGLIMELPRYHRPRLRPLLQKTWFRLKEFVVIAWPILIAGSVVLEVFDHYRWSGPLNGLLTPYTSTLLGFPPAVGVTLLFGILRKELALVLLFAALGTSEVPSVMTTAQIFGYTFFVTFYVPCLATFAALTKEFGGKAAISVTLSTLVIVTALTVALRFAMQIALG